MKIHGISSFLLAMAVSVSTPAWGENTVQWGQAGSSGSISSTASQDLRWKKPKVADSTPKTGSGIVTADYVSDSSSVRQVQFETPVTPPIATPPRPQQLTPAQQDFLYPEKRLPAPPNPPAGATSTPLVPTNPPSVFSSDKPALSTEEKKSDSSSIQTPSGVQGMDKPAMSGTAPAPKPLTQAPSTLSSSSSRGHHDRKCPGTAGFKSIKEISYDIRPMPGELPKECPLVTTAYNGRNFGQTCFQWKASALCTKGAYFEDPQLERYGHTICPYLEPIISGGKFFLTIPLLPYYMGVQPPTECNYTLGYYRVGNCSPYMLDPFPLSVRAVLFEAAAVGGAIALIP